MFTVQFWVSCGIIAVISYLLGSLNTAIILSKTVEKDDVRKHGSGNAGMTNILRTYGKKHAVITACGDLLKAVVAVLIARVIFRYSGYIESYAGYVAGLFVMLGHLFPLYFGFKGGKGVVTMLGVIMMVNPIVFLILCAVFIPLVFITRIVSIGSILGAIAYPILTLVVRMIQGRPVIFETSCALITCFVLLFVHRGNIKRLLNGTENRFGGKPKK
ncbi:glycerol-3-phosphate 1-O-acyltransferase PlsY [Ruminococcaceae bacterium OttesenSCG-928-L11]|nr:glycerol-3-phosphate 1-O-acyltransferase PlsY [Ruminococcaceae bacterium OttesenSCG-928-L11]